MLENSLKLRQDEKIVIIARPDWGAYKFKLFTLFTLVLGISFFFFFLIEQGVYGYAIIVSSIFLALIYLWRILVVHYFNVYIVTNARIIGIDQIGIFKRKIASIEIKNIKIAEYFKKNGLYIRLINDKSLILKDLNDRDYIGDVINDLVESKRNENRTFEFVKKELS